MFIGQPEQFSRRLLSNSLVEPPELFRPRDQLGDRFLSSCVSDEDERGGGYTMNLRPILMSSVDNKRVNHISEPDVLLYVLVAFSAPFRAGYDGVQLQLSLSFSF